VSTSGEIVYTTLNYVLISMNTDTTVQKLLQEFRYMVRKKIKGKNKSGMVAKASDYVVNPQIWPHTARIYFAFLLGE
jgi:hypothetical protein